MSSSKLLIAAAVALFSLDGLAQAQTTTVGFDGGTSGDFIGNFTFEPAGGNPGGNARCDLSTFFPSLRTGGAPGGGQPTNPDFVGDYSAFCAVTFGMDVKVDSLTDFIGNQIQRPLGIALIDHDIQGPSGPSGVFFELAALSSTNQANWTALSVTIDDPTSATIPMGWIGFGDEDPSFAPILPVGATFASVLAGVDEVRITGAVPGFFFNNAFYDMRIDNVTVTKTGSATTSNVGFDGGTSGDFIGNFTFETAGGNPGGNARCDLSTFFPSLRTGGMGQPTNSDFVGDYSSVAQVTFGMDVKVDSLTDFIGNQIQRPLGIALVDHDIQGPSGPSGVFFELAALSSTNQANWTALSVTINDTTSLTIPGGWIGFGDEDPSFAPILPAGATFASVLAGVDEVRITGAVPGFFFNNAFYDMRIDNVSVTKTGSCFGTSYCGANVNSTGLPGELFAAGSNVVASNDLTLTASNIPVGEFGYVLVASATATVPIFNSGVLCLGGGIGRFNQVGQIGQANAAGQFSLAVDLTQLPTPMLPVSAAPGDTFYFQAWYREVGTSSNFTNGLQVDFQ